MYSEQNEKPYNDEFDPRTTLVGAGLAKEREVPTGSAFIRQEKATAELEMAIEQLQHKLQPVSSEQVRDETMSEANPRSGSSQFVRAIDEQTDRIFRITRRVRSMTEGLEI